MNTPEAIRQFGNVLMGELNELTFTRDNGDTVEITVKKPEPKDELLERLQRENPEYDVFRGDGETIDEDVSEMFTNYKNIGKWESHSNTSTLLLSVIYRKPKRKLEPVNRIGVWEVDGTKRSLFAGPSSCEDFVAIDEKGEFFLQFPEDDQGRFIRELTDEERIEITLKMTIPED